MKHASRTLLLAVLAAAAMAAVGAGSATATVLCKTNASTTGCGAANHVKKGETIEAAIEMGNTIFENKSGVTQWKCPSSAIRGTTEQTGSATETVGLEVPETGLSFSNCGVEFENTLPGTIEIHWIPKTDNATLTVKGFKIRIEAFPGEICIYEFPSTFTDMGELQGGNPAHIFVKATIPRTNKCVFSPDPLIWTGTYQVRTPNPLYVTEG